MLFSVLASGSKGNACYVETDNTKILIDAGISCRELLKRLDIEGVLLNDLDAIILTHEHQDHTKGAGPISRRFNVPVYSNNPTMQGSNRTLGKIETHVAIETGNSLSIGDLEVETFSKSHDAADPIGLVISSNHSRLGILTDVGECTDIIEDHLKDCTAVLLEFNHDIDMLDNGPYPFYLKKRIKSSRGHLSNLEAAEFLKRLAHDKLDHIILAHLSEINNSPEKAILEAKKALMETGMERVAVHVSYQDYPCPLMEI
ncbi:MBL fold metallo-hydrolase [Thermodesulfobacteriota bacterium]